MYWAPQYAKCIMLTLYVPHTYTIREYVYDIYIAYNARPNHSSFYFNEYIRFFDNTVNVNM
jgi:hypothetical protein